MQFLNEEELKKLALSQKLEYARDQISYSRGILQDAIHTHGWKDRIEHICGLLTCGLHVLYDSKAEVVKSEIRQLDATRGPHIKFASRGTGLDMVPCCFVCGTKERESGANEYLHNIAAFVDSKADGEKLVEWFATRARLDFRPSEPSWIQLKVGACTKHLSNLKHLDEVTRQYRVIRQIDIADAITLPN